MGRILSDGQRGHNGGVTQSVFLKHKGKHDGLASRKAKLAGDFNQFWKDMKEDGLVRSDFEYALKQDALTAAERAQSHNNRRAYLRFMGHVDVADAMGEMDENAFDEVGKTPEEREAHWRDHGKRHGLEGKGLDVAMGEHTTDSEAGQWIQQGWAEGQAELAKGIKPMPASEPAKGKRGAAKASSDAETGKLNGGVQQPQHEPEVAAAKARGRKGGVSYRHDPEKRKVYEVSIADAIPEGSVNITRPEYDKLKTQYAAEEEEAWQQTAPTGDGEQTSDDGFDDPPTPDAA